MPTAIQLGPQETQLFFWSGKMPFLSQKKADTVFPAEFCFLKK